MRWIVCVFAGFVAALLPLGAAPRHKESPRPALYYPTAVGTEWVYSYTAGIDTSRAKRRVVKAEPRDGGILVSIDREWDGKVAADSRVLVSADGLLALPATEKESDPPFWVLRCPIVRGKSWELPRTGWNPPRITCTVAGIEEVAVSAGRFEAVRVDVEWHEPGCRPSRSAAWYARDVGLVKKVRQGEVTELLMSFVPGKK